MQSDLKELAETLELATEEFFQDILALECGFRAKEEPYFLPELFTCELVDSYQDRAMDYLTQHAGDIAMTARQIVELYQERRQAAAAQAIRVNTGGERPQRKPSV